jgi:aldehyde dehydrogenase (NAD+)
VKTLRVAFESGTTRPLKHRMEQLAAFKRMITEGEEDIAAALQDDLGKSQFDTFFTELGMVHVEIQYFMDHLKELMQPEARSTGIACQPGKSMVLSDPLGLVLVMGAWNYPINLSLVPMVGAIAAGNCVMLKPAQVCVCV